MLIVSTLDIVKWMLLNEVQAYEEYDFFFGSYYSNREDISPPRKKWLYLWKSLERTTDGFSHLLFLRISALGLFDYFKESFHRDNSIL